MNKNEKIFKERLSKINPNETNLQQITRNYVINLKTSQTI